MWWRLQKQILSCKTESKDWPNTIRYHNFITDASLTGTWVRRGRAGAEHKTHTVNIITKLAGRRSNLGLCWVKDWWRNLQRFKTVKTVVFNFFYFVCHHFSPSRVDLGGQNLGLTFLNGIYVFMYYLHVSSYLKKDHKTTFCRLVSWQVEQ